MPEYTAQYNIVNDPFLGFVIRIRILFNDAPVFEMFLSEDDAADMVTTLYCTVEELAELKEKRDNN